MKNKPSAKTPSGSQLVAIGASVAAVAATAYFFLGPNGKKHQKHAKAWAIKMKGDIVEKLEAARDMTEPVYHQIIDTVSAKYEKNAKLSRDEVVALAQDLKKHWKTLGTTARAVKHDVVKHVKKVTKKKA